MTSEIITKQFKRGMTVEQIAMLHGIEVEQIKEIVKGVEVERTVEKPTDLHIVKKRRTKGRIPIDFKRVEELLKDGLTVPQIAEEIDVKYSTLILRLQEKPELKELATSVRKETSRKRMAEMRAAEKEVAVTTESDGFAKNYTIAHMTKEEAEMTEAIAEVKQETEERNEPNDKWVHFVANQIDNARIKTKFDVVQEGKKFIKRTEVRFVIEEVL